MKLTGETDLLHGSCLCGAITFEITSPFTKFAHCHCRRCRKATGAAHASNIYLDPGQLHWLQGQQHIIKYNLPEAASFARWFCGRCGAPVPRISRSGRTAVVPAGALEEHPANLPRARIFCGSEAPWTCRGDDITRYDEYPEWW